MLEPSSSEEEDDEVVDAPGHFSSANGGPHAGGGGGRGKLDVPNGTANGPRASPAPAPKAGDKDRAGSPSPSVNEPTLTEAELQVRHVIFSFGFFSWFNGLRP